MMQYTLKELSRFPEELEMDWDDETQKHVSYGKINTYWLYGESNEKKIKLDILVPNHPIKTLPFNTVSEAKRHIIHRELGIC